MATGKVNWVGETQTQIAKNQLIEKLQLMVFSTLDKGSAVT